MCPGLTRSVSTAIVAGTTRPEPYLARSSETWSMPLSKGTIARTASGFLRAASAGSNCVAFTVIQSTSTGGTSAVTKTSTVNLPKGLSRLSCLGYCASASRRTTSVTESPACARQEPISPPTPPAPRIACRIVPGILTSTAVPLHCRRWQALRNLNITQRVITRLGALVDAFDQIVARRNATQLQPEQHIRLPAHGPDVNDLLQPEHMRGHARVNRVRQHNIVLAIRLDDRRRMHARGRAKSVVSHHRIVRRNGHAGGPRHGLAILYQLTEVLLSPGRNPHEFEIDQHLIHLRITHALTQTDSASVNAIGPGNQSRYRIGNRQAAIAVPMPIQTNPFAGGFHHFLDHKPHQRERSHGRGMPCCVADHDSARAATNCRGIQPLHRLRITARRVLSDVHRIEAERNRIFHSLLGGLQKKIVAPTFREPPDRTGTDERSGLDAQTRLLHDLRNGTNIVLVRPRRAVGANLHLVRDHLPRQRSHMLHCARPRAWQSQIERVDPQRLHQMKNFNFFGNRRIAHRGRLQPIAEALIIQLNRSRRLQSRRMILVPVVDEFGSVHRSCHYPVPS